MKTIARSTWPMWILVAGATMVAGCQSTSPCDPPTDKERTEMLNLMLPQQIEVMPFTKIASFDEEDSIPDGVLAVVRPVDRFGGPVKAVGFFYFDLWTYRNASQDRKGKRLAHWERTIASEQEVRLYWTRAQMLEFQLAWTQGIDAIKPNRKYVLTATYRTPWEETLTDEYVIDFTIPAGMQDAAK